LSCCGPTFKSFFEPDLPSVHHFFSISTTCRCLDEFELPVTAAVETATAETTSVETSGKLDCPREK